MIDSLPLKTACITLFGLLIGSFLNVVIHRFPQMLSREWEEQCDVYAREIGLLPENTPPRAHKEVFNLSQPRSRCPSCGHVVRWYENIPILSYLGLRGRCSGCGTPIGLRYPLVELLTGTLFYICAVQGGFTLATAAWCGFCATLVALAFIDWDTTLLPDDMTLPLMWAGLLAAVLGWTHATTADAIVGAAAGYLSLWSVYWAFKWVTGKEGMGAGDFKLFAALGAWFGWQALVPIVLMASVIGSVIGLVLKCFKRLREGNLYLPFGPFLAMGGVATLIWDPQHIMQTVLRLLGL